MSTLRIGIVGVGADRDMTGVEVEFGGTCALDALFEWSVTVGWCVCGEAGVQSRDFAG